MKTEGTYVRCERCGKSEFYSAGGYKPSIDIQIADDGWHQHNGKDLCSECTELYIKMIDEFFNEVWDK